MKGWGYPQQIGGSSRQFVSRADRARNSVAAGIEQGVGQGSDIGWVFACLDTLIHVA